MRLFLLTTLTMIAFATNSVPNRLSVGGGHRGAIGALGGVALAALPGRGRLTADASAFCSASRQFQRRSSNLSAIVPQLYRAPLNPDARQVSLPFTT